MRRLPLKNTVNFRDLGGFPTDTGESTRFERVFRSDCPATFEDWELEIIKNKNIRVAIDIRAIHELEKRPSAFSRMEGLVYHHCPFLLGDQGPETEADIPGLYLCFLEDFMNIKRIMDIIAKSDGAVVYHCAVGKDRTGLVTAVLLSLCGVFESDILADYQVSYTYLRSLIRVLQDEHPDWPDWKGKSEMVYMEGALNLLIQKYGSFEGYCKAASLTDETIGMIRKKLLL